MKEKEQKARELMRTSYETAVGGTVSRRGLEETGSDGGSGGESGRKSGSVGEGEMRGGGESWRCGRGRGRSGSFAIWFGSGLTVRRWLASLGKLFLRTPMGNGMHVCTVPLQDVILFWFRYPFGLEVCAFDFIVPSICLTSPGYVPALLKICASGSCYWHGMSNFVGETEPLSSLLSLCNTHKP